MLLSASSTLWSPSPVTTVADLCPATKYRLFMPTWVGPVVEHLAVARKRSMDAAMRRRSAGPSGKKEFNSL
jgi:hypothetical protein